MRKFKKILLGALSILTFGLIAVTTGAKVNAATANGTYTFLPETFWTHSGTKENAPVTSVQDGLFTLLSNTSSTQQVYGTRATAQNKTLSNTTGKVWENEVLIGGAKEISINLDLSDAQQATVTMYGYADGSKEITVCGTKSTPTAYVVTGSSEIWSASNKTVKLASNYVLLSIEVNVISVTTYDVTFNSMGGSSVAKQTIVEGGKATEPTVPTKANNKFVGWYTSTDSGTTLSDTAFSFENTTITSDLTLYAKWEEATVYTVTFMNGTETYATKYVYDGENSNMVSDWPTNPMKAGYTFNGWYNSTTPYTSSSVFNESITLTASYTQFLLEVNNSYTFSASNTTSNSDSSIINSTNGTFFMENVAGKGVKVSGSNFSFANGSDGTTQKNYLGFNIPANSYVIISLTGTATHGLDSNNNEKYAKVDCKLNGTTVTTDFFEPTSTTNQAILYNKTSDVSMVQLYRYGNTTLTISSISVSVYSSVSTVNEAQSRGNGSAIRFAATLSNVGSLDIVSKWSYTLSLEGYDDVVSGDMTVLYTAISGTNGKAAAANTYYIVLTVNSIPSSFNGKELKCKFTVTLSDGTVIETNQVAETISVTVSE